MFLSSYSLRIYAYVLFVVSEAEEIIDVDFNSEDDVFQEQTAELPLAPISKPRAQSLSALPKKKQDEVKAGRKTNQVVYQLDGLVKS